MKISSKKTGLWHEISTEQWEAMLKNGDSRKYKVEVLGDEEMHSIEVKVEPIEIFREEVIEGVVDEVIDANDDLAEVKETPSVDNDDKEFYKSELDKRGVEYRWNTGIEKLKKLYEENL